MALYVSVMFPEEVTAAPAVRKGALVVSIPTLVTVPLVAGFCQAIAEPVLVKTLPLVPIVLNPVPPLPIARGVVDKVKDVALIAEELIEPTLRLLIVKAPVLVSCINPVTPDPKVMPFPTKL